MESRLSSNSLLSENIDTAVGGVHVPFPKEWLEKLRAISPIQDKHSWLLPYWYKAQNRWVLYDCLPRPFLDTEKEVVVGMKGTEMLAALEGPPPRLLPDDEYNPYVSDVQHEIYRLHKVYARPFWILQGNNGGHQVTFDPWQQNILRAKRLPDVPPQIGSLPPCPFDNRVIRQLERLNRLNQLGGSLAELEKSGSSWAVQSEMENIKRQIREADIPFLEDQAAEVTDLLKTIHSKSDGRHHIGNNGDGMSALADEGLAAYVETGDFIH